MCNNNNCISNIKIIPVNKEGPIGLPSLSFSISQWLLRARKVLKQAHCFLFAVAWGTNEIGKIRQDKDKIRGRRQYKTRQAPVDKRETSTRGQAREREWERKGKAQLMRLCQLFYWEQRPKAYKKKPHCGFFSHNAHRYDNRILKKAVMRILSISMRSLFSLELITTDGKFKRHAHVITRVIPITKKEQAFETKEFRKSGILINARLGSLFWCVLVCVRILVCVSET